LGKNRCRVSSFDYSLHYSRFPDDPKARARQGTLHSGIRGINMESLEMAVASNDATSDRLARLSKDLDIIAPLIRGEIVYLDYPVYANIGDLLIWKGASVFLRRHRCRILGQYSKENVVGVRARNQIERSKTICFQGGGNFGDLWPWSQWLREEIIQAYPRKRIIIFPQSVRYDNSGTLAKSCEILRKHPDLHIFLRDRTSLATLEAHGVPNLRLCPDTAHALWGKLATRRPTQSKPLYLLRRDKEEGPLPPGINASDVKVVDWEDSFRRQEWRALGFGVKINDTDARRGNKLHASLVWSIVSRFLIRRAIGLFAPYQTIVTNRLHATILALLLGRKVIVYDNSYGKLSSYIHCWLNDLPDIQIQATYRANSGESPDFTSLGLPAH
jgi:pyruvyl transferase EpsO